jgi:hypothetical protein
MLIHNTSFDYARTGDALAIAFDNSGNTLTTGSENDLLSFTASATGRDSSASASATAIDNTEGEIDTGDGRDTIVARAIAKIFNTTAIAIDNTNGVINMGDCHDSLRATATAYGDGSAIGIKGGTVNMGDGDDYVGVNILGDSIDDFGIEDTTINCGAGNDTIDFGNAAVNIGDIYGQGDIDTLILMGTSTDYTFTPVDPLDPSAFLITHTDPTNPTNLEVSGVEIFQFV